MVCSEVACHDDFMFITVDVEKAFLQGMTHGEIEASTGEVQRRAYFDLPPGSAAVLRQILGYEDFAVRMPDEPQTWNRNEGCAKSVLISVGFSHTRTEVSDEVHNL